MFRHIVFPRQLNNMLCSKGKYSNLLELHRALHSLVTTCYADTASQSSSICYLQHARCKVVHLLVNIQMQFVCGGSSHKAETFTKISMYRSGRNVCVPIPSAAPAPTVSAKSR